MCVCVHHTHTYTHTCSVCGVSLIILVSRAYTATVVCRACACACSQELTKSLERESLLLCQRAAPAHLRAQAVETRRDRDVRGALGGGRVAQDAQAPPLTRSEEEANGSIRRYYQQWKPSALDCEDCAVAQSGDVSDTVLSHTSSNAAHNARKSERHYHKRPTRGYAGEMGKGEQDGRGGEGRGEEGGRSGRARQQREMLDTSVQGGGDVTSGSSERNEAGDAALTER